MTLGDMAVNQCRLRGLGESLREGMIAAGGIACGDFLPFRMAESVEQLQRFGGHVPSICVHGFSTRSMTQNDRPKFATQVVTQWAGVPDGNG